MRGIANRFGMDGVDFSFNTYDQANAASAADWPGDLDRMLNPDTARRDIQYYYDIERGFSSRKPIVNYDDMEIITNSDQNDMKLLMFRDSFANALLPLLSNNFGEAAYLRAVPFAFNRAVVRGYDFVVLEIAERNITLLAQSAPIAAAPRRDGLRTVAGGAVPMNAVSITMKSGQYGSFYKMAGYFDPHELYNGVSRIYIAVTPAGAQPDSSGIQDNSGVYDYSGINDYPGINEHTGIYEAYPILDADIRQEARDIYGAKAEDAGFTLYLDGDELQEGEYEARLMLESPEGESKLSGAFARFIYE
jgi:hypothetical protein